MPKYTVEFGDSIDASLSKLAETKKTTKADIIRRAIASYQFLIDQVDTAKGEKVAISNSENQVLKEVALP